MGTLYKYATHTLSWHTWTKLTHIEHNNLSLKKVEKNYKLRRTKAETKWLCVLTEKIV
jgi:hypothetical protein